MGRWLGWGGSVMLGSVSSTSAMRSAETEARGRMMNIMDMNMNAKKICMVYCINAIISPTCMRAAATWCAPTHTTRMETLLIRNIMTGIMITITRLTNRLLPVRSRLAWSKRRSSNSCWLKARTTIMPLKFSRTTRFRLSIRVWISLKRGSVTEKTLMMTASSTATIRAMIHHIEGALSSARIMPPMPMMGA